MRGLDDRVIRADYLEWILTGTRDDQTSIRNVRIVGAVIEGEIALTGALITHPLDFTECTFTAAPQLLDATVLSLRLERCTVPGISATGLTVHGSIDLTGIISTGEVRLLRAKVGGALILEGSQLSSAETGVALMASQAHFGSSVRFIRSTVEGQVRLIGARIGGVLNARSATFRNPGQLCFQAERIEVDEGIWFNREDVDSDSSTVEGRVTIDGARVAGSVDFSGCTMSAPELNTKDFDLAGQLVNLQATGIRVGRNLLCRDGFSATGVIAMNSAAVERTISFDGARISPIRLGGVEIAVIRLADASAQTLTLTFAEPPNHLDLTNAKVGLLNDAEESWPAAIALDGLTYERLSSATTVTVARRLTWLTRGEKGYLPQPYEQLAAVYQRSGQEQEARSVGFEKQKQRARTLRRFARIWPLILGATVGYGYKTWMAGVWLVVLLIGGSALFAAGSTVPTTTMGPEFNPLIYTVDLLVPVVEFGQESNWRPEGTLRWLAWGYTAAGWILTSAVAAGLTRLLKRA
ncbi:hypothetical protein F4553_006179 [Allocatelliglobosispora scoriae]|uniref:Oxidoreductase n=1 Tax=Allocatelliglobosispora scoriae TaxID=643052 RepID=A0A841BYK0_9ACTN|nr:hypothetical protein [Allocatelliglobosispora scoriae]MBB5872745.1 hypothetical protein [Allocatelliglobosispora scoriae]